MKLISSLKPTCCISLPALGLAFSLLAIASCSVLFSDEASNGECTPMVCASQGDQCGILDDGCGGTIDCECISPCTNTSTCNDLGADCGPIVDDCGAEMDCGGCQNGGVGDTCGGAGEDNICGCTPTTCLAQAADCGEMLDGCGTTLDCGDACEVGVCGGGDTPNQCGLGDCVPGTCDSLNATCGSVAVGCGIVLDCGTCISPDSCTNNACSCAPTTCVAESATCGSLDNGCGVALDCGSCSAAGTCMANACVCEEGCGPLVIAEEQLGVGEMVISDGYIYWFASLGGGGLQTFAILRRAFGVGVPEVFIDKLSNPRTLGVDDTHVYWGANGSVRRVAKSEYTGEPIACTAGSPPCQSVSAGKGSNGLVLDETHVYWTTNNEVFARNKNLATERFAISQVGGNGISIDANYVYWATRPVEDGGTGAIVRFGKTVNGQVEEIIGNLADPAIVVVGDGQIFWTDSETDQLLKTAKNGEGTTEVVGTGRITSVAVDDTHVYWTVPAASLLLRQPKAGGPLQPLAEAPLAQRPRHVVVDDLHVYWGDGQSRKILNLARCGCNGL